MACRWCKKDVAPSAKFCPHCGAENPYEDNSMSTIESIKYLLSTPTNSVDAWIRLIICSLILYFLFVMGSGAIREEGINFTPIGIFVNLIIISILILFIYAWLKAFNYIFPSNTSKDIDELFYKSIFSIQFIKFMYSKKFFTAMLKTFKCMAWTPEGRFKKTMKEFKLKSLKEAEIVDRKLTNAGLAHILIPFILLSIYVLIFY